MRITTDPYYFKNKSPKLRKEVTSAVSALEARGRLEDAVELVRLAKRLDEAPGKNLDSMHRWASIKAAPKPFIENHGGKLVGGTLLATTIAGGYLANRAGAGILLTGLGAFFGFAAGGAAAGFAGTYIEGFLHHNDGVVGKVEQFRKGLAAGIPDFPVDESEPVPRGEGKIGELIQTARTLSSEFYKRQEESLEREFEWFQGEENFSELTTAQFRSRMKRDEWITKPLEGMMKLALPSALVGSGAAGVAAHMAGASWWLTGLAAGGALVGGLFAAGAVSEQIDSFAEQFRHPDWEKKLDRLEFAARPAEEPVPEFSLQGYVNLINEEFPYVKSGDVERLGRVRDRIDGASPRYGLASACHDAGLYGADIQLLSKDWYKRSVVSFQEQLPDSVIDIEAGEDSIIVGSQELPILD